MSNIPKRNLASVCHLLKKLINLRGEQLDVTTNINLKSCTYHPDSECCTFFHGNLSNLKFSEDTLLYLYVIWNMLKSVDLHETILTPVSCHKHLITMAWRCISPWSFHRSPQRRREMEILVVTTYMFVTNDRCEDNQLGGWFRFQNQCTFGEILF